MAAEYGGCVDGNQWRQFSGDGSVLVDSGRM